MRASCSQAFKQLDQLHLCGMAPLICRPPWHSLAVSCSTSLDVKLQTVHNSAVKSTGFITTVSPYSSKLEAIGGTWMDNTDLGCNMVSHPSTASRLFSLLFEVFSGQVEIWPYMRDVAKREGWPKYIKSGTKVESAELDEIKG